ncbi:MAG: S4 domain-containing protein, partial [Pyrinomonadaceae bacterium]
EERVVDSQVYRLSELIALTGLAASKGEAKRLIEQGGVKINGEKATLATAEIKIQPGDDVLLQVGKLKFLRVKGS